MLSMLDIIQPQETGSVRELWRRITTPPVSAFLRPAGCGNYLRISCEQRRGRIDWRMIRSYSLDCMDRILMPSKIEPPAETELRRFVPFAFNRRMLENMTMDILARSQVRPELRRAAVYGQDSEVAALLPRLCCFAGEIRVITRRPHAVADTVEQLRANYGAAISVTDQFDARGFDILLAPAGGAAVFETGENTVVLAPDRPSAKAGLWIRAAVPPLPLSLADEYDDRYDINEFVGAFYEAGEMRELSRLMPEYGVTESGSVSSSDVALLFNR